MASVGRIRLYLRKKVRAIPRNLLLLVGLLLSCAVYSQKIVSKVVVEGNKKTKDAALLKLIRVKPGMAVDSVRMEEDVSRLKRLPSVAHAFFEVRDTNVKDSYEIKYGVEENFTIIPFANIFTSNDDEFAFRVGLQEFNFLGRNMTLGAFYQYDVFSSFGANLRAPFLFSETFGLSIAYQNLTTQEPVFLDNGTAEYRYNNESIEVLGLINLGSRHQIEAGLNFFTEDYDFLFGATDASVPQELVVDKALFKLIYNYDGVTYYYHYLEGFKSVLNMQYVTSNDPALPEFWIGFDDFSYYHRVGARGNWASRLRLGLASNIDTPFAPFAVDNNLNIRGVGNTIDRGTAAIVLNTEYRHTLMDKDWFVLQSNVFVDGGTWRNPGGDFGDFGQSQNLRVYPGVGIRFIHKRIFNAIFRIDYGIGITEDATRGVVFGIGQYF